MFTAADLYVHFMLQHSQKRAKYRNDRCPYDQHVVCSIIYLCQYILITFRMLHVLHHVPLDLKYCFFSIFQKEFGTDCKLIERIEENRYNTYASAEWKNKKKHMFVGLSANGKPMRAKKTRRKNTATHFLPIPIAQGLYTGSIHCTEETLGTFFYSIKRCLWKAALCTVTELNSLLFAIYINYWHLR